MRTTFFRSFVVLGLVVSVFAGTHAHACGDYADLELYKLGPVALGDDDVAAAIAIEAMRERGQRAVDFLRVVYAEALKETDEHGRPTAQALATRAVLDAVARQRDAHASGLFWHTDLDAAREVATATGKPILSLRLLGQLDEELSCANSRFFRTALYANEELAKLLRSRFVLHWKSVRPVPVITIDMGDGRTICRTITGNSIHYVLMPDGRPVDALPGLYGPSAFRTGLERAEALVKTLAEHTAEARDAALAAWHAERAERIDASWAADLARIGQVVPRRMVAVDAAVAPEATQPAAEAAPSAAEAAPRAHGKMILELPLVRALQPRAVSLADATSAAAWAAIATLHADAARLDAGSIALMRAKTPSAAAAGVLAASKRRVEDPMLRVVRTFERSLAEDTVRNEYGFHRTLHDWFANGSAGTDVEALNERVYAELFLTPSSDPWLGLVPADAYAALDAGGLGAR